MIFNPWFQLTTVLLALSCCPAFAEQSLCAKVIYPAPVFNSRSAAGSTSPPKPDACGQTRSLEFIAMPGTPVMIVSEFRTGAATVYQVETKAYTPPEGVNLFVSSEYLAPCDSPMRQPVISLPAKDQIIASLRQSVGLPYVWGSNLSTGIRWKDGSRQYTGVDCSGLLYEATKGFTPRNSSDLVNFGVGVEIEGLTAEQIKGLLKPLDLLVWKGHVIIVLDDDSAIESSLSCSKPGRGGVSITPLKARLLQIMQTRTPVNRWPEKRTKTERFVVRRWIATE